MSANICRLAVITGAWLRNGWEKSSRFLLVHKSVVILYPLTNPPQFYLGDPGFVHTFTLVNPSPLGKWKVAMFWQEMSVQNVSSGLYWCHWEAYWFVGDAEQ